MSMSASARSASALSKKNRGAISRKKTSVFCYHIRAFPRQFRPRPYRPHQSDSPQLLIVRAMGAPHARMDPYDMAFMHTPPNRIGLMSPLHALR